MATTAIEINILRISPDGKLMEFNIDCPDTYYFTDFVINVVGSNDYYSIAESVFGSELVSSTTGAFELATIKGTPQSIYHVKLTAKIKDTSSTEEPLTANAYISDVSSVYNCLIDDIVAFDGNCGDTSVLNRVIRNYLMLYAHLEALHLGYLDEAQDWLNKLSNCFSNCSGNKEKRGFNLGCGCGRK